MRIIIQSYDLCFTFDLQSTGTFKVFEAEFKNGQTRCRISKSKYSVSLHTMKLWAKIIFFNFRSSIHEVGLGKSKVRRKTIPSMQSVFSDCKRDSITQTESLSSTSQKSQKFYRLRATILPVFLPVDVIQEIQALYSPNSYRQ